MITDPGHSPDSISGEHHDGAEHAPLRVRRMKAADTEPVAELAAAAFSRDISDPLAARRWRERTAYPRSTDPEGAFVAELDGRIIGAAEAMVRERLWCLSLLAVQPGIQSRGAGRALLERTMAYGRGTDAGLIVSSNDPRALYLYAAHGFALYPTFAAEGTVDRGRLPRPDRGVREVDGSDLESLAAVARAIRGAPYTSELQYALGRGARLLRLADRGLAVVVEQRPAWLLVARDEDAATALLSYALALADGHTSVKWITGAQQWAIEVLIRARLRLVANGALCVRGAPGPLRPFLPSASFA